MRPKSLSLAVVGADYPNKAGPGRRFEIAMCEPGEPVDLVPEPDNPADVNAVAVFSERGIQIGYLTAERAPLLSRDLRAGRIVTAVFQQPATWGATIRVAFDGAAPLLPPRRAQAAEEQDFWPDYLPPDD